MNPKAANQNAQFEAQQETLLNTPISQPPPLWPSKRFLVAVLMALCYLNSIFSRFNISIAIVEMTYPKIIKIGNSTLTRPPEFNWDSTTVGLTLSIFYYGGFVSFLGSFMVSQLGGVSSCTLAMMVSGIITILHPISLQHSFFSFLVCRFIVGICESLLLISISEVSSQWTPQNENSKLISISTSGVNIGVAIVHGVCAFLAHTCGWRMIFYVTGSISLITSSICFIFIKNRPSDDKRISKQELIYIQEGIAINSKKEVTHPYRDIISSSAVWALLSGRFTAALGVAFVSTFLPMYIKDTTQSDINEVGLISSVPNALNIFMLPVCGMLLDYGKNINISVTLMHKILIGGSFILIGTLFASTAMISNFIVSIIFFLLIQTLLFVVNLVTQIIIISIAPNSSSIIAGLCAAVLAISCILTRNLTASMTTNHTLEEWNRCLLVMGGISLLGGVLFIVWGSSEAQPWSIVSSTPQGDQGNQTDKKLNKRCHVRHPYRKIISSAAVWAILANKFAMIAGMTFISTFLPMYIKDITQKDTNEVGIISSIPNAINIFMLPICGILLDYGKSINISVTRMHKIIIGGAFILTGILFATSAMISNFIVPIMCFMVIQTLQFVISLVSQVIVISIAPNSSSIVAGLTTTVTSLSSIITRSTIASMTTNHTLVEWNRCMLVVSGISLLGGVFFMLGGSSEVQPWSFVSSIERDDQENQKDKKVSN